MIANKLPNFYSAYECDVIDINSLKIFTFKNQCLEKKYHQIAIA